MNRLAKIAALAALCLSPVLALAGEPDKALEEKVVRPTVLVYDQKTGCHGSGTIIRCTKLEDGTHANIVLTCHHVVDGMTRVIVGVTGYRGYSNPVRQDEYNGLVMALNRKNDMALVMFVSKSPMWVADIGFEEKLYIGNDVIACGCAWRENPRIDYGKFTGRMYTDWLRCAVNAIPGDSGGGLFHNNKLVGIKAQHKVIYKNKVSYPVFNLSHHVSVSALDKWAKNDKTAVIFKKDAAVPKLSLIKLSVTSFQPKDELALEVFPVFGN